MAFKVLILGGTSAGRELAEQLTRDARFAPLLSFAGRTTTSQLPKLPHRIGGFGGAQGLAQFLSCERFAAMVDATHAFAAQISTNASAAADATRIPFMRLEVPAWKPSPLDRWTEVGSMDEAARALGPTPRRVLLTIGRLEVAAFRAAPQHAYLIRAIDPFDPELPDARILTARGPFQLSDELSLMQRERIDIVVSKNAGTASTYAKLEAARQLELPVIMVARPQLPAAAVAHDVATVRAWLQALLSMA